jgi:hypothetical protein
LICRADALMLGVSGALLVRSARASLLLLRYRWIMSIAAFVLGAGIVLATFRQCGNVICCLCDVDAFVGFVEIL